MTPHDLLANIHNKPQLSPMIIISRQTLLILYRTSPVRSVTNLLLASTSEPSLARAVSLSLAGLVTIRLVVTITTSLYSF